MGKLIDEDELIKGRVENDPVVIAAKCVPTAYDLDKVVAQLDAHFNATENKTARLAYHHAIKIVRDGGVRSRKNYESPNNA